MLETSYLVMETHANSTPVHCPNVCYLHVLTKGQGKEAWALPKKLAKAVDDYLAKEGCLEDPFSKQILRNYQPCASSPKTPEQHKECVNQKNTVDLNSCPIFQNTANLFIIVCRGVRMDFICLFILCSSELISLKTSTTKGSNRVSRV